MSRIVKKLVTVLLVLGLLAPQGVFGAVVSGQNFNKGAYIFTEKNGVREYYVPGQSKPVFATNMKNAPDELEATRGKNPTGTVNTQTKNIKKSQMKASAEKNKEIKQNNYKNNPTGVDRISGKTVSKYKKVSAPGYAADEVIVKYKSGTNKNTVNSINSKYFAAKGKSLKLINADVMKLQKGKKVEDVVKALKADKNVEFAEPNYKVQAAGITTDPRSDQLWGFENYGQPILGNPGTEDVDIDATDAWNNTMGNDQVIVAIIDTGVDINHPDLNGRIWTNPGEIAGNGIDDDGNGYIDDVNGWDFYNYDNSVFDPEQGDDHGTHVSGTIAADLNTIGVVGIAPNVKIMPLKFLGPQGGYNSDAVLAIDYAKSHGVKIINASWGGGDYSEALRQAILNSGCLFAAAAGNDSNNTDENPYYPSSYDCDNIISTAAVDNNGNLAWFSNYGLQTVDVAAPGVDILSTIPKLPAQGAAIMSSTGVYKTLFQGFGLEIVDTQQGRQDIISGALGFFGVNSSDKILLVQDDGSDSDQNTNVLSYYQDSLTALGCSDITNYKVALGQNGPDQSTLSQYKLVVWFTGDSVESDFQVPNIKESDQGNLESYLNAGGNLYIAGRDAGWGMENTDFYVNYLHTQFLYEDDYRQSIYGNAGTIFEGETYNLIPSIWMDYLKPSDSLGATALTYTPDMDYSNAYAYYGGTSMAAPHVSGIAALLASNNLNEPLTIKNNIIAGSQPMASLNGLVGVGAMVNANNALSSDPDDDIPGVPLKDSNPSAVDQDTDLDDVYNIFLQAGESVKFTLSGDPGTDFDLYLYAPWATTVKNADGMIRYSENEGSSEQIEYVAEETGTYYVDVYAYSGSGAYTLNFERGQRIFDDRNPELDYTGNWQDLNSELHEYGTAKTINSAGKVTCWFTGHNVKWTGFKDNKQGIAKVYIDGTLAGQVDLYSTTPKYKQLLFEKEVDYGFHEMTIQWAGLWDKAAKKSSTAINVDTILVQTSIPKPPAPANLNAMGVTNGIILSFNSVTLTYVTGYNIYRSLDDVTYSQIYFIPQDSSINQVYCWDSVYEDRDYFYKVTSLSSSGIQSDPSDVVVARPIIPNSVYTLEDTSNHFSYAGEWATENDPAYSNGTRHTALQAGASVEIPVTGYQSEVTLMMGPDMGMARVYYPGSDGSFWQDFDLYSENPGWWTIGETQPVRMVGDHFTVECVSGKISFDYAEIYDIDADNPAAPTGLGGSINGDSVTLNWTDSVDADVMGFDVYRSTNGSEYQKLNTELITDLIYTDNSAVFGNDYCYSVAAVSFAGLVSAYSNEYTQDRRPPAAPVGLSLTRNGSNVDLNWTPNVEPDLAGYNIYRSATAGSGYVMINPSLVTGTSYTDSGLAIGPDYYYVIRAVDTSGNESGDSNEVRLDVTPPAAPMNLTGVRNGSSVNLSWATNTETDLAGYNVYRSMTHGGGYMIINASPVTGTSYTDSSLINGNAYYYIVKAVDTSGNVSASSNEMQFLPPSPPSGGTTRVEETDQAISYTGTWTVHTSTSDSGGAGKYSATTGNSLTFTFIGTGIKWIAMVNTSRGIARVTLDGVAENVDQYCATTQYKKVVYEKNNLTSGQHTIKIEVTGLTSSTGKTIFIDAFDVINSLPLAAPNGLTLIKNGSDSVLNWTANTESNIAGYNIYRSTIAGSGYEKINSSLVTGTSYTDSSIAAGIDYYYVIRAVSTIGDLSPNSNEVKLDQTPPAAPANLTGIRNGSSVNLSWAANTETDLAGYNVYRSTIAGSGYTMINPSQVTGTSYIDSNLTDGVTYYYVVRTVDLSGNVSTSSNEVQIFPTPTGGTTRVEETNPAISYTGTWTVHTSTSDSGGAGKYSANVGNYLTFTFTGTGIKWIAMVNTSRGIARVTLDGVAENVDQYCATTQYKKVVYEKNNLTSGQHTIKIEVTGLTSSTGKVVFIDAFDVTN